MQLTIQNSNWYLILNDILSVRLNEVFKKIHASLLKYVSIGVKRIPYCTDPKVLKIGEKIQMERTLSNNDLTIEYVHIMFNKDELGFPHAW